jgi:protein-disulfide isomerase|tara:strand:+ start:459 stop:1157 length:699 start_codon:yes stop_codon:yes gene_type:complete
MKRILPMIVAALVGVGAYFIFVHEPSSTAAQSAELTAPAEAVATEVTDNADGDAEVDTSTIPDMMIGNPDAKVTVIEYASYTCPHCASFHTGTFKDLKKNYIDTDKINFVFREVYFDRYGLWASMIARCAGPEKFFGLTDLMFQSQSSWTRAGEPAAIIDELRKLGRLAGIDGETLEVCLNDNDKAKTLIAWYQEKAGADNIDSTPSFIINGKKHTNMSFAEMSEIIDADLE